MNTEYCVYVVVPRTPDVPAVLGVTNSSVILMCDPHEYSHYYGIDNFKLQYRKAGERSWTVMPETTNRTQTVTALDHSTLYQFAVSGNLAGGRWSSPSQPLSVKTLTNSRGKCVD